MQIHMMHVYVVTEARHVAGVFHTADDALLFAWRRVFDHNVGPLGLAHTRATQPQVLVLAWRPGAAHASQTIELRWDELRSALLEHAIFDLHVKVMSTDAVAPPPELQRFQHTH